MDIQPKISGATVELKNIFKNYHIGRGEIEVLKGITLTLQPGSWNMLLGASGSGKTTLLNIIGALEKPTSGEIVYNNRNYAKLGDGNLSSLRNQSIGFVFQSYHLLPELTLLENVMLPGLISGHRDLKNKATELLDEMGLAQRRKHYPCELSGGEQQRAAIARALINEPELLLADEPTGNLDLQTGNEILDIFANLTTSAGRPTIFMITHNEHISGFADRVFKLTDGVLEQ
ncbi:MAG: ABC transporter ATP-binding protein [Lentisphaeria bacterium]|nr:ABC transporter ATP-binding protein [Lentisphaeria bacterium]